VELKFACSRRNFRRSASFNQTKVELKSFQVFIDRLRGSLLIRPKWN